MCEGERGKLWEKESGTGFPRATVGKRKFPHGEIAAAQNSEALPVGLGLLSVCSASCSRGQGGQAPGQDPKPNGGPTVGLAWSLAYKDPLDPLPPPQHPASKVDLVTLASSTRKVWVPRLGHTRASPLTTVCVPKLGVLQTESRGTRA